MEVVVQQTAGTALFRSLLLPILFLAPGIPALRARRWAARREGSPSRLQAVVYGTLLSTASLVTVYVALSVYAWQPLTAEHIDFTAPTFFTLLPIHFVITAVYGLIAGEFQYNYYTGNRPRDLYDSWDFAFEKVCEQEDVLVKTTGGTWVSGRVVQHGSSAGTRDLLLGSAQLVDPADSANPTVVPEGEPELRPLHGSSGTLLVDDSSQDAPGEGQSGTKDTENDMDSVFDDSEVSNESISEDATNYVYINEPDIETVVLSSGADLSPEAPLSANRPGKVQAVVQSLTGDTSLSAPDESQLFSLNNIMVSIVFAVLYTPTLVSFHDVFELSTYRASLYFVFFLSSVLGGLRIGQRRGTDSITWRHSFIPKVNAPLILIAVEALAFTVCVVYVPTLLVPVVEGVVAGSLLSILHAGLSEEFDRTAAVLSSSLALLIVIGITFWIETDTVELGGQTVVGIGLSLLALLVVDRLRVGTPSAYEGWSEVFRYLCWWSIGVGLAAALAAPPLYVTTWQAGSYTAVLVLSGILLSHHLFEAVNKTFEGT